MKSDCMTANLLGVFHLLGSSSLGQPDASSMDFPPAMPFTLLVLFLLEISGDICSDCDPIFLAAKFSSSAPCPALSHRQKSPP